MTSTLYGIPNCDTVKRARAWLAGQGVAIHFHDYKKAGVPADRLDAWIAALGWERLLNRQGTTWRKLDEPTRAAVVDAASARALMLAQASVIRRPVVEWADGALSVGFDEAEFARHAR
ncbi:ArsC family reductase [Aquincola sp. S2]|uniref:ArsC family reductase n=1 Tax=Pseudaquabacterium terrae TaxID=2732868 RepID=A0ABX2EFM9_9BURK|nr:ArsC family reductase [Aquabacterium terrae]NRF67440.1 ArsC family reductase [Aquabacterium terrae]